MDNIEGELEPAMADVKLFDLTAARPQSWTKFKTGLHVSRV